MTSKPPTLLSDADYLNLVLVIISLIIGVVAARVTDSAIIGLSLSVFLLLAVCGLLVRHAFRQANYIRTANDRISKLETATGPRARARRLVAGEAFFAGLRVVVLENSGQMREGALMTLYCSSSGADQPLCLLKLVKVVKGQDVLAVTYPGPDLAAALVSYFDDESKRNSLYAVDGVHAQELESFLNKALQNAQ